MDDLEQLAEQIKRLNGVMDEIAAVIGRPALIGHVGEYIASHIFTIALTESAVEKSIDGHFTHYPLEGRSVEIKWYAKREGVLDLKLQPLPDFYLVMTGPKSVALSSRGATRPWLIDAVYLFDVPELMRALSARGVQLGVATSVHRHLWEEAEIYPRQHNQRLILTDAQRALLKLFG